MTETCEALETPRSTYYRWKEHGVQPSTPGPKDADPDIVATMIDEVRQLRHVKRRTWGTEAIYLAYHRLLPYSVIKEAIHLERSDRARIERKESKRYEFAGPNVAWSMDFIKVSGGRILRIDDDATRLSLVSEFRADWQEDSVARLVSDTCERFGSPLAFKHDRGPEFKSEVVQTVLRSREIIALPNPPYWPRSNGKQERKNESVRQWLGPLQPDLMTADETMDEVTQALMDNNTRPKEILGGLSPREAFLRWPRPDLDRHVLYQDWDGLREQLLQDRARGRTIDIELQLEAMRIAAITVLRRRRLVWFGSRLEAPGSVT